MDCDLEFKIIKLTGYLKEGYPFSGVKKHYQRVRKLCQSELLDNVPKSTTDTPVMVTLYLTPGTHLLAPSSEINGTLFRTLMN